MLLNPVKKGSENKTTLRNYFIIRTAYVTGWRASESLSCDPFKDIDWETGEVHIPRRKGGKDRCVYLDPETTKLLKQWYFSNYPNGKRLWYAMRGIAKGKPLAYMGYMRVFQEYFGKGSHRVRASYATYLISQGVDIERRVLVKWNGYAFNKV